MPIIGKPADEKEKTIGEKQTYFVVKANELIQQSRFTMTTQQSKMLLFLISKIKPFDTGEEIYSFPIKEFCEVCNIEEDNNRNFINAKKSLKGLADKSVWVVQPNGDEILLRWLDRVRLNRTTNCFEVSFHRDMLPYLFDLQKKYTKYSLSNVLTMRSKYGIRLYELLKSYKYFNKPITFTIDELKKRLDAENYNRYPDFKVNVLDKAVSDINYCSDIEVTYKPQKSGNSKGFVYIIFNISSPSYYIDKLRNVRRYRKLSKTYRKTNKGNERWNTQ